MAKINLDLLVKCDDLQQKYNKVCVETCAESGMTLQDAWDVYNWQSMPANSHMPDEFEAEIFKSNMGVFDTGAIRCLGKPFMQNEFTVFHLSNGLKNVDSASIFLRLFAVPKDIVPLGAGAIEVHEICNIVTTPIKGVKVAMKLSDGTRQQDIPLDESNMTITYGGKQYKVYYDIVGMGYHVKNRAYEFIRYNKKIFLEGKFSFDGI